MVGLSSIFASMQDFFFLVGYVSNYNLFPEPLTPEEESKYLELYENGDEDAKRILIERNLRLVAHIAKKYINSNVLKEIKLFYQDDYLRPAFLNFFCYCITFD